MTTKSVQQKQAGERRWLVKDEQGGVFGPVAFETLKEWAQDGRLSPTSMVSENNMAWSPVTHLHGLGMDWVAETSPGVFYGPIHHQALEGLLKDGTLTTTAVLFARNNRAGQPADAGQALSECVAQAEHAQALLTAQIAQLTAQLAERDARLRRLEQQATDANVLQLFSQQIIAAQEMVAQQILDAVAGQAEQAQHIKDALANSLAHVPKAVARALAPELANDRQSLAQQITAAQEAAAQQVLDAVAGAQETVPTAVAHALAPELANGRKTVLDAISGIQPQTAEAVHREAAALAQEVKAGQGQTLSAMTQQFSDGMSALEQAFAAGQKTAPPPVERVYVEAEAVEVLPPPEMPPPHGHRAHHKPPPPESPPPAKATHQEARKNGGKLSMAELEQQAQRELERLGAQGVNLFKRKS